MLCLCLPSRPGTVRNFLPVYMRSVGLPYLSSAYDHTFHVRSSLKLQLVPNTLCPFLALAMPSEQLCPYWVLLHIPESTVLSEHAYCAITKSLSLPLLTVAAFRMKRT